jgi:hypothetical protein
MPSWTWGTWTGGTWTGGTWTGGTWTQGTWHLIPGLISFGDKFKQRYSDTSDYIDVQLK